MMKCKLSAKRAEPDLEEFARILDDRFEKHCLFDSGLHIPLPCLLKQKCKESNGTVSAGTLPFVRIVFFKEADIRHI